MSNLNDIFFTPAANQELTYDQVLEDVQRYFAENHASTIAEAGEGNAERATSLLKELMEHYIVKRKYALDGLSTKELCSKLYEDMAGYSFLKKWIYKPGVEEVNINAYNDIEVIESSGRSIKISDKFSSPQHAIDVIRRMLNACGMVIDDTMPSIVGFLDKNIRISVDKTPIVDADVGVNASIRIVNQQTVSEEKLLNSGSATAEMLHFLTACIRYGVSVCIAGSTGSGKTTIMAWLLSNVPNNRRLITIEEGSREFDLVKRDAQGNILNSVVHLLTRPSENPALNINQDFLLERVLRKHPDVIGVGEMRSAAESLSAAESSRTGHTVCTTIHSNSCNSTYRRMMTLAKRKYNMDDSILMQIMVFKEIYDAPTLLTYGFNVDEALQPQMEEFLSSYVSENTSVAYTSTKLLKEQLDSVRSMILVIGGLIGCIMAFAGLINFTNMIITNIITRRHEFATMQSIGMTGKQLRCLTVYEGIYYAVGADIIGGAVAAILAVTVLKSALNGPSMWFFTLNITLVPVLVIGVLYLLLAAVIPLIVLHFFNKGTVVERLRTSE
ncbi:ATPase, T2SS/T4P/T4SS family [Dysosmobacter sp.]